VSSCTEFVESREPGRFLADNTWTDGPKGCNLVVLTQPQEARKHHYVPRFYLKRFADADDMLTVVDRRFGTVKRKSPSAVFWEIDYYRVDGDEGTDPTAWETAFGKLEDRAALVLNQVDQQRRLPAPGDASYSTLINFVALQAVRGPHARRRLAEPHRVLERVLEHAEQLREAFGAQMRNPERVDELRHFVERKQVTADHLDALSTAMNAILQPLAGRSWTLLHPADRCTFVTSDHPVALTWRSRADSGFFGPGFGLPDTDVTLPLDPDTLLLGRFEGVPESGVVLTEAVTASVNSRTLSHAVRFAASAGDSIVWSAHGQVVGTEQLRELWRSNTVAPEEDLKVYGGPGSAA
jgi:hypothetical protein